MKKEREVIQDKIRASLRDLEAAGVAFTNHDWDLAERKVSDARSKLAGLSDWIEPRKGV